MYIRKAIKNIEVDYVDVQKGALRFWDLNWQ